MKDFPDHIFISDKPKNPVFNYNSSKMWEDGESPYELMKKNAENSSKQLETMQAQIAPLKELSESAKRQADSAEQIANSSNKIAEKANKKSHTATIISIISLAVALLTNLDKIAANVYWLITYLPKMLH